MNINHEVKQFVHNRLKIVGKLWDMKNENCYFFRVIFKIYIHSARFEMQLKVMYGQGCLFLSLTSIQKYVTKNSLQTTNVYYIKGYFNNFSSFYIIYLFE